MTQSELPPPPTLEEVRQYADRSGYFHLLDLRVDQAQDGSGAVSLSVDARLHHPQQVVHGGVIFTLADTAMAMAVISVLPPETPFSTIEAKINFLRAVRTGELRAEATILHQGRSTIVLEATVYNKETEEQQPIARALGTFHIGKRKQS
ncbi:MAG TPA: PaaI family thioesterase [Ktedonobacteraceae bacterium]